MLPQWNCCFRCDNGWWLKNETLFATLQWVKGKKNWHIFYLNLLLLTFFDHLVSRITQYSDHKRRGKNFKFWGMKLVCTVVFSKIHRADPEYVVCLRFKSVWYIILIQNHELRSFKAISYRLDLFFTTSIFWNSAIWQFPDFSHFSFLKYVRYERGFYVQGYFNASLSSLRPCRNFSTFTAS